MAILRRRQSSRLDKVGVREDAARFDDHVQRIGDIDRDDTASVIAAYPLGDNIHMIISIRRARNDVSATLQILILDTSKQTDVCRHTDIPRRQDTSLADGVKHGPFRAHGQAIQPLELRRFVRHYCDGDIHGTRRCYPQNNETTRIVRGARIAQQVPTSKDILLVMGRNHCAKPSQARQVISVATEPCAALKPTSTNVDCHQTVEFIDIGRCRRCDNAALWVRAVRYIWKCC